MHTLFNKIAAILAFIIGLMAVFAGGQVLLGRVPGYNVIDWLPLYNYTLGVATVLLTAGLLWIDSRLALPAAMGTFGLHVAVTLTLLTVYRGVVAAESLQAMTLRLAVWVIILALTFARRRIARAGPARIEAGSLSARSA